MRWAKRFFLILVLLYLPVLLAQAEVYKWVDEQGDVHYGDKPDSVQSEQLKIQQQSPSTPTNNLSDAERRQYQQKLLESMTYERQQKEQAKAKDKKEREKAKQKCDKAKQKLTKMKQAGYLYSKNEQGERLVLDDEQHKAATAQVEAAIKKHCK